MATLVVLIIASAIILAALCLGNAVAIHLRRHRIRRDADAAAARLNNRYQDALRQMRRH
ncbi:hypothetical protein SCMU_22810 [Sinomonas cyclohexanicum]|uniref:Uncharacterized protein n=1 Tax=Sinomonas cyclohexanicum TaxID=322009 RepID=A0ABN6FHU0_SINCY|nr:hypothetical protein [Corynebacterium cyclohexanicum]BCT76439.1 hypothetical protein SCMU_22810 [Corynebacterium cyclohexanicum]